MPARVPADVRVGSALAAVVVAWFLADRAFYFAGQGYAYTPAAVAASLLPLVAILSALALYPDPSADLVRRRTAADPAVPSQALAFVLVATTLVVVFGLGTLVDTVRSLEDVYRFGKSLEEISEFSRGDVVSGILFNLVVFLLPAAVYVSATAQGDGRSLAARLGLVDRSPVRALAAGVGTTAAIFVVLGLIGVLIELLGGEVPTNPRALGIVEELDVPLAFLLAAGAALGEEVFFRGFLLPRVGLAAQAGLFGLAHANFLTLEQVVATGVLGLVLGLLTIARGSILAAVAVHFLFNFVMVLLAQA
ncbi:MAG: lysostaphin resistance A-like protein [Methanobacteriota archaeon]